MNLIIKDRGMGKTTDLLRLSDRTKIPIICKDPELLKKMASDLLLDIPSPISYYDCFLGRKFTKTKEVYIDELDWFLRTILNANVVCATMSPESSSTTKAEVRSQLESLIDDISSGLQKLKEDIRL